jgi:hypothetical protein
MPIKFLTHEVPTVVSGADSEPDSVTMHEAQLISEPLITSGWCSSLPEAFDRINMLRQGKLPSTAVPNGQATPSQLMAALARAGDAFRCPLGAAQDEVVLALREALRCGPDTPGWAYASAMLESLRFSAVNPNRGEP